MPSHRSSPSLRVLGAGFLLLTLVVGSRPCAAAPVFGFREDWSGTSLKGWAGGGGSGVVLSNPGTGGTFGSGDGYLLLQLTDPGQFGARSTGVEYQGNWRLAGIEQVKIALNDVGAPDTLEIHFCIGNASNFWEANYGFVPTNGVWRDYVVNLLFESEFTRIIGTGTFEQALASTDRILLRNDRAPYTQNPDPSHGDFGIDRIILTAVATPAKRVTWGRIKAMYR